MKGYLNTGEGRKEIATRTKPAIRSNAKWIYTRRLFRKALADDLFRFQ